MSFNLFSNVLHKFIKVIGGVNLIIISPLTLIPLINKIILEFHPACVKALVSRGEEEKVEV